jgi:hypothetical protein
MAAEPLNMAQKSRSEPVSPIALEHREYPRMQAKSSESAEGGGDGILGDSGMCVGIGTAEGPQQLPKRDRRWTAISVKVG